MNRTQMRKIKNTVGGGVWTLKNKRRHMQKKKKKVKAWSLRGNANSEPNQNSMKNTRQLPSTAPYRQNKNSNPEKKIKRCKIA